MNRAFIFIFWQVGLRLLSARFFIFFVFLIAPLAFVSAVQAAAAPSHRASCDEDFHEVLEARAWMLASREYETAQKYMDHAESVLQYTCHNYAFNDFEGNNIDQFDDALDEHITSNFGATTCKNMLSLWNLARCADFQMADFINFTAGEYQGPRSCPSPTDRTDAWDAAVAASQPAAATPAASGGMEAVVTYLDRLSWLKASSCSSSDAVDTGVVYRNLADSAYVDEMVCLTPGCYFNGSSCE